MKARTDSYWPIMWYCWIAVLFKHAVGSIRFVCVIEIGLTHKPYASDGAFNVTCNPQ
jgi:hypothetical protein